MAGCIIAKLPSSWRNFATTLKYKRQEILVEDLIASLDVEEKVRAKEMLLRNEARVTLASTWCRRITHTARTKWQPTSLSRLLSSRIRRLQKPKELAN